MLKIIVTSDLVTAGALVADGYCPVECSIGGESVVDDLLMDHHGKYSHLEGVAVRAYRDHFGARRADPCFVTALPGDADSLFAIAALAGILPHPSQPEFLPPSFRQDVMIQANAINLLDTDPVGRNIRGTETLLMVRLWSDLVGFVHNEMTALTGAQMWVNLLTGRVGPYLKAAEAAETDNINRSWDDLVQRGVRLPTDNWQPDTTVLLLPQCTGSHFDTWYQRRSIDLDPTKASTWKHPVVLAKGAYSPTELTIGCPNKEVAEELFGPGGLKNVFPVLSQAILPGWGGREAIGGSPRGSDLSPSQCQKAANVVAGMIK